MEKSPPSALLPLSPPPPLHSTMNNASVYPAFEKYMKEAYHLYDDDDDADEADTKGHKFPETDFVVMESVQFPEESWRAITAGLKKRPLTEEELTHC